MPQCLVMMQPHPRFQWAGTPPMKGTHVYRVAPVTLDNEPVRPGLVTAAQG
ncbi:hypothetical protein C8E89_1271 [Mycolicibacterium moriokaense]|uniref:Uncharacterized protein n=1 Tax=Mycolicibacterium moriokaense TaxID=39691 RepID=A0A318HBF4_9MYCO|nr:hypothetical protein C8E89_1271 [Mycolicibacterium moriokaense]